MTDFDLSGRTALVTGASRGIGRAIAAALAAHGADLALGGRDAAALEETRKAVESYGRTAFVLTGDLTDPSAVAELVEGALSSLGHLDVVVNNAGGSRFSAPFVGLRPAGWDKTLQLNLGSVVEVCRAVGPHLLERRTGSVINVASMAGLTGVPTMSHYGAAKAAVVSLTKSLAVEWAASGVRVNAICPGWIATDLTAYARDDEAIGRALISRVPMGRWGTPEEVAGPAVFLASGASRFITGQVLIVDGGLTAW
jgi:2-deoxy-D-gluconate 3-dehydrogenase